MLDRVRQLATLRLDDISLFLTKPLICSELTSLSNWDKYKEGVCLVGSWKEFNRGNHAAGAREGMIEEDEYGLGNWLVSEASRAGLCTSDLADSGRIGILNSDLGREIVETKDPLALLVAASIVEEGLKTEVTLEAKLMGDVVENTDRAGEELGGAGADGDAFLSDTDNPISLIMDKAFSKSAPERNLIWTRRT